MYLNYFSIAMIKHGDQGNIQKQGFTLGLCFQRDNSSWWKKRVVGAGGWNSSRESTSETMRVFGNLKAHLQGQTSSIKVTPPGHPQTATNCGPRIQMPETDGVISFNDIIAWLHL